MLSASYFSLLAPAVELASAPTSWGEAWAFLPATVGFLLGALFVYAGDKYGPVDAMSSFLAIAGPDAHAKKNDDLPASHPDSFESPRQFNQADLRRRKATGEDVEAADGDNTAHKSAAQLRAEKKLQLHRVFLLVFAVTIHNFPEGLAVGVGFGAAGLSGSSSLQSAWALAIGIGLQNFPEGFAGEMIAVNVS